MASKHKPGIVTHFIHETEFNAETKNSKSYGRYVEMTIIQPGPPFGQAVFNRSIFELTLHARRRHAKAIMVAVPDNMLGLFVASGFIRPAGWDMHVLVIS
jgi:hypothetical protein